MKILVRGTNWLGDAVMTTPALLRLREKFPDAQITLLSAEKLRELWQNHPAIDEIISFKPDESVFVVAKKLRAEKFDQAIIFPNSPRSAIEVFLAGVPKRIGYARPWRNFFLTQKTLQRADAVKMQKRSESEIRNLISENSGNRIRKLGLSKSANQIFEYLHLAASLGASPEPLPPKLFVSSEEIDAAKKKFGLEKITNSVFGLNPGAEYGPAKRWPVEKFISAAKEIQSKTNCTWVLFGGKNDLAITSQIASKLSSQPLNLAGKTSLRELMALLKSCRVLLTNDTGPMHVASALEVSVVAIFGSTSPELTGPIFSPRATILKSEAACSPCFLRECPIDFRCMNKISVESAVKSVLETIR